MAKDEHLARIRQGVAVWNDWWTKHFDEAVDLRGADLRGADLQGVDLQGGFWNWADLTSWTAAMYSYSYRRITDPDLTSVDLRGADLREAKLRSTNFSGADLRRADLRGADLGRATLTSVDLRGADLQGVDLSRANLRSTNFSGADLSRANMQGASLRGADLSSARLIGVNLMDADLTGCRVYGISAWDLKLEGAIQRDLVITPPDQPEITVDKIEIGQFIYLLLNNSKIRDIIDTITQRVVLILGRFTPERKCVLDALRELLRNHDYVPVVFDFAKPGTRTTLETVSTLAHMALFIIADITDAKSILQELQAVVPTNPSVPVQPLLLASQEEPGMFDFFCRFPWVLQTYYYPAPNELLAVLGDRIIAPAETKAIELKEIPGNCSDIPFP